jgi:hypothetical protein
MVIYTVMYAVWACRRVQFRMQIKQVSSTCLRNRNRLGGNEASQPIL